jgi:nudix-type nucleoside diphosphatase (YffH/AdpP family)
VSRVLSINEVYKGWSRFSLVRFRLDDGSELERCVEDHGAAAVVLPYDPERRVAMLVRQFRPGPELVGERSDLEAPAGLIDPGEDGAASARREAFEETGLRLAELERVGRCWSSPGSTTESSELFLAVYSPASRVGEGGGVDDGEKLEILETPLSELGARLERGEIADLKLLALVQALKLRRPELFS